MLTERRINYVRHHAAKLLSAEKLIKAAKNPALVSKYIKGLFFDVNLTNPFKDVERSAATALARLSAQFRGPTVPFNAWLPFGAISPDALDLAALFTKHGSDKSTHHDYHLVYGPMLSGKRDKAINILEIGLGTNNIDVPSNMGLWGKPGASLRAFRDWAPRSQIYGADVDRRVLFEEDRIATSWVDQSDTTSLAALGASFRGKKFDLIIDDGLHLPHANFNALFELLPLLADDGFFVVEDIEAGHRAYWDIAQSVLSPIYDCCLIEAKGGLLFVVRHG